MPSGRTHADISIVIAGLTYTYLIRQNEPPVLAITTALGIIMGILITPDLDVKGTRADRIVRTRIGTLPAIMWGILWNPYSKLIPHRSVMSHGIIIGTAIRLIYISVPLLLFGLFPTPGPILTRIIIGIFISDNFHIGADFFVTGIKDIYEYEKDKLLRQILH